MASMTEFSKAAEGSITMGGVNRSQYPTKTYQESTTNYASYSSGPQVVSTSYTSGPTTTSYTTGQTTSYSAQPMTTTSYMTGQPSVTTTSRTIQGPMMMGSPGPISASKTSTMMTTSSPMPSGTRVVTSGPTTTTTGVTENGMAYTTTTSSKQSSVQYTGESQQRYVPLGTQPVMAYPHNVRTLYDPNLVPAFVAPPQVSVTPGYVSRWPTQLTASQPQQPSQPF